MESSSNPVRLFYVPQSTDTAVMLYQDESSLMAWKLSLEITSISKRILFEVGLLAPQNDLVSLGQRAQFSLNFAKNPVRAVFMTSIHPQTDPLPSILKEFQLEVDVESRDDDLWHIKKNSDSQNPVNLVELASEVYQELKCFEVITDEEEETLIAHLKSITHTNDIDEAVQIFMQNLDHDKVDDLLNAAHCFHFGIGIDIDDEIAAHFYAEAAEKKSEVGMIQMTLAYLFGRGVQRDHDRSIIYLNEALALDSPKAKILLGLYHQCGIFDGPPNLEAAFHAFQSASLHDDPHAIFNLAKCFLFARGTPPKSPPECLEIVKQAADKGYAEAHFFSARVLGMARQYGLLEATNDYVLKKIIIQHFIDASMLGHADAQKRLAALEKSRIESMMSEEGPMFHLNLGIAHIRGLGGMQRDAKIAFENIQSTSLMGLPVAHSIIGLLHEIGFGTPQDQTMATLLFCRGTILKDAGSHFHYARCLWSGLGVDPEKAKAIEHIHEAAALGHPVAKRFRYLLNRGSPIFFKSAQNYLNSQWFVL